MHGRFFLYVHVCCMRVKCRCHPKDIRSTYACISLYILCVYSAPENVTLVPAKKSVTKLHPSISAGSSGHPLRFRGDTGHRQGMFNENILKWRNWRVLSMSSMASCLATDFIWNPRDGSAAVFYSLFEGHVWQLSLRQRGSRAVQDWSWSRKINCGIDSDTSRCFILLCFGCLFFPAARNLFSAASLATHWCKLVILISNDGQLVRFVWLSQHHAIWSGSHRTVQHRWGERSDC